MGPEWTQEEEKDLGTGLAQEPRAWVEYKGALLGQRDNTSTRVEAEFLKQ